MVSSNHTSTKPTILVADDDPFFRRLLTYQLTKAGYQILTASNGREALNWIQQDQQKIDLVVLDLLMPHYSGIEIIARIRTLPYKLPVILMSMAEEHIAREGISDSAPDLFLKKPSTTVELLAGVKSLLLNEYSIEPLETI